MADTSTHFARCCSTVEVHTCFADDRRLNALCAKYVGKRPITAVALFSVVHKISPKDHTEILRKLVNLGELDIITVRTSMHFGTHLLSG